MLTDPRSPASALSSRTPALGRAVLLERTGVWVVRVSGRIAEFEGRTFWHDRRALAADAARAGVALTEQPLRTGAAVH